MIHSYYGIWDNIAKCYAWVGESKNNATFARMCSVMAKDEKTFIGQFEPGVVLRALPDEGRFVFLHYVAHSCKGCVVFAFAYPCVALCYIVPDSEILMLHFSFLSLTGGCRRA